MRTATVVITLAAGFEIHDSTGRRDDKRPEFDGIPSSSHTQSVREEQP